MLCLMSVSSPPPSFYVCAYVSVICYFGCFGCGGSLVSCIVMMSGCVVYASCLSSSCLFVMSLMCTCSMVMPVARGDVVWFRTCALATAPACGLATHTDVGPEFDSTSPAKSIRFASHRT